MGVVLRLCQSGCHHSQPPRVYYHWSITCSLAVLSDNVFIIEHKGGDHLYIICAAKRSRSQWRIIWEYQQLNAKHSGDHLRQCFLFRRRLSPLFTSPFYSTSRSEVCVRVCVCVCMVITFIFRLRFCVLLTHIWPQAVLLLPPIPLRCFPLINKSTKRCSIFK